MLGIDIGHGAIKLAVMTRKRRGWYLRALAVQPLPPGAGSIRAQDNAARQNCLLESTSVREAIASALRQLPVARRKAALALSCADAITRTIRLDTGLSEQEVENQLAVQAEQHLPFPLAEASMDFCRLPQITGGSVSGQDVLMVACRHERVAQFVRLLSGLGVNAQAVELDALALYRIAAQQPSRAPNLLLDMGSGGFRLHAFAGGRLLYSRAHQWAEAVSGESYPLALSQSDLTQVPRLTQEIKRAVQLFLISTACKELASISLAGGVASMPGLKAGISQACGRSAGLLQLPSGISMHPSIKLSRWRAQSPQLSLACGLAMRGG